MSNFKYTKNVVMQLIILMIESKIIIPADFAYLRSLIRTYQTKTKIMSIILYYWKKK